DPVHRWPEPERPRWRVPERFYGARVLALRARAAIRGEARRDRHRVSADAGSGQLQPRGGEGEKRGEDPGPTGAIREGNMPISNSLPHDPVARKQITNMLEGGRAVHA